MDYRSFLFSFEGRINRARCWLASLMILCAMIFSLLMLAVICISHGISTGPLSIHLGGISASINFKLTDGDAPAALLPRIAVLVMTLAFGWRYAAISIKRLHDLDKSAWWIVPYLVVPGLHGQFGDWLGDSWPAELIGYATPIAFLCGFVELYCLKGTRGPNRFGPDPLAPDVVSVKEAPRWEQHGVLEFPVAGAGPWPGPHVKRGA
jgi:uncharacterized membrane protein YhaH (DUF805 family)